MVYSDVEGTGRKGSGERGKERDRAGKMNRNLIFPLLQYYILIRGNER
jgi:hypothetical protein